MLRFLYVVLAIESTAFSGIFRRYAMVSSHSINGASGVCASRNHRDVLYTHNNSGGVNRIVAISATSGKRFGTITIDSSTYNWEDIACGPCQGGLGHCIYIANTRVNEGRDLNNIYSVREPLEIYDHQHVPLESVIEFSWDQHTCGTVMVDKHGEVYVLSKVSAGHHPKLVHLPRSSWGANLRVQVNDGVNLPITSSSYNLVWGDISSSGKEVLVKAYGQVYYWYVPDGNFYAYMQTKPSKLPYHGENQGESICFDARGSGYFIMSEGNEPPFYTKF